MHFGRRVALSEEHFKMTIISLYFRNTCKEMYDRHEWHVNQAQGR